jgi:hypothetical protein
LRGLARRREGGDRLGQRAKRALRDSRHPHPVAQRRRDLVGAEALRKAHREPSDPLADPQQGGPELRLEIARHVGRRGRRRLALDLLGGRDEPLEERAHGAVGGRREARGSRGLARSGQPAVEHLALALRRLEREAGAALGLRDERHQGEALVDRRDQRREGRRGARVGPPEVRLAQARERSVRLAREQPRVELAGEVPALGAHQVRLAVAREGAEQRRTGRLPQPARRLELVAHHRVDEARGERSRHGGVRGDRDQRRAGEAAAGRALEMPARVDSDARLGIVEGVEARVAGRVAHEGHGPGLGHGDAEAADRRALRPHRHTGHRDVEAARREVHLEPGPAEGHELEGLASLGREGAGDRDVEARGAAVSGGAEGRVVAARPDAQGLRGRAGRQGGRAGQRGEAARRGREAAGAPAGRADAPRQGFDRRAPVL